MGSQQTCVFSHSTFSSVASELEHPSYSKQLQSLLWLTRARKVEKIGIEESRRDLASRQQQARRKGEEDRNNAPLKREKNLEAHLANNFVLNKPHPALQIPYTYSLLSYFPFH
ncbi:unnamed protein product [Citrullus colocynthis]|uniref:Uncharacterized protein n=1 Tax=Citrullus colocynthis TaxID=252529 RepID=A0ABP0XW47_9ROSI